MLTNFLEQQDLFLMNSFFKNQGLSRKWSWKSPDGSMANEIDYILMNKRRTTKS